MDRCFGLCHHHTSPGADNKIHSTIALIEDISERKNIEEKLSASEQEYRLLGRIFP